jgi:ABC-type Fe3+/spermidine/putrescine transport system ATPase subunit
LGRPDEAGAIAGRVIDSSFVGDRTEYRIETSFGQVNAVELNSVVRQSGDCVGLSVAADDIKIVAG